MNLAHSTMQGSQYRITSHRPGLGGERVYNRATGQKRADVPRWDVEATPQAIEAGSAVGRLWSKKIGKQWAAALRRGFERVSANPQTTLVIQTNDAWKAGAPGKVDRASSVVHSDEEAKRIDGETIPSCRFGTRIVERTLPIGIAAATPCNFHAVIGSRKVSPLALGGAAVAKPALEILPMASALTALAEGAGLPEGVVITRDARGTGSVPGDHLRVHCLGWTGSAKKGSFMQGRRRREGSSVVLGEMKYSRMGGLAA
jgi:succinate-semialdehyde dehydrogenase/glutarate-semialdehyde dehydrogenase